LRPLQLSIGINHCNSRVSLKAHSEKQLVLHTVIHVESFQDFPLYPKCSGEAIIYTLYQRVTHYELYFYEYLQRFNSRFPFKLMHRKGTGEFYSPLFLTRLKTTSPRVIPSSTRLFFRNLRILIKHLNEYFIKMDILIKFTKLFFEKNIRGSQNSYQYFRNLYKLIKYYCHIFMKSYIFIKNTNMETMPANAGKAFSFAEGKNLSPKSCFRML